VRMGQLATTLAMKFNEVSYCPSHRLRMLEELKMIHHHWKTGSASSVQSCFAMFRVLHKNRCCSSPQYMPVYDLGNGYDPLSSSFMKNLEVRAIYRLKFSAVFLSKSENLPVRWMNEQTPASNHIHRNSYNIYINSLVSWSVYERLVCQCMSAVTRVTLLRLGVLF
jgi:hypothetical protein